MQRGLRTAAFLYALGTAVFAAAQPDAQVRRPALGPGDLLLVRGTGVVPHLDVAVGLDADLVRCPILVVDRALDLERAAVETRLTTTLLYAVGVLDHSQATLAVPLTWQEGAGRAVLTRDDRDRLSAAVVGDLRLDFAHTLTPGCAPIGTGQGACDFGLLAASGLVVPTGDERAFAGDRGLAAYAQVAGEGRVGALVLKGAWSTTVRRVAELAGEPLGSDMSFALGAGLELLDARLVVAAEAEALVGLRGGAVPIAALVEVRGRLGTARSAEIALGVGRGVNDALRSPGLQVVLTLRAIPW